MNEQSAEALKGTGWQIAVAQNPHTQRWHWVAWTGNASFSDAGFIKAWNNGNEQSELTRTEAVEAAVRHSLDQHAGWVEPTLLEETP